MRTFCPVFDDAMVDKIQKALDKLTPKEKARIEAILNDVKNGNISGRQYDIKKLKGREDIYRIRKGNIRVIYRVDERRNVFVLAVERRSDTTYHA